MIGTTEGTLVIIISILYLLAGWMLVNLSMAIAVYDKELRIPMGNKLLRLVIFVFWPVITFYMMVRLRSATKAGARHDS